MARVDDYVNAGKIVREKLKAASFEDIAKYSGFAPADSRTFRVPFLNRAFHVSYPEFEFTDAIKFGADIALQEQVLILHYMSALKATAPVGQWIAYREIPGAAFYFTAFVKRAIDPLKKVFGKNVAALISAAEKLDGKPIDIGDAGFEFRVFPKVPLQIVIYEGDEEFEAEANLLFDAKAGEFLSPEDAAWLAGMVVYRLIAIGR